MFGLSSYRAPKPDPEDEVAVLRDKLREAEAFIERLRDALGSNHPLGRQRGLWG